MAEFGLCCKAAYIILAVCDIIRSVLLKIGNRNLPSSLRCCLPVSSRRSQSAFPASQNRINNDIMAQFPLRFLKLSASIWSGTWAWRGCSLFNANSLSHHIIVKNSCDCARCYNQLICQWPAYKASVVMLGNSENEAGNNDLAYLIFRLSFLRLFCLPYCVLKYILA